VVSVNDLVRQAAGPRKSNGAGQHAVVEMLAAISTPRHRPVESASSVEHAERAEVVERSHPRLRARLVDA
jgi:hypothetical protein